MKSLANVFSENHMLLTSKVLNSLIVVLKSTSDLSIVSVIIEFLIITLKNDKFNKIIENSQLLDFLVPIHAILNHKEYLQISFYDDK
jgi:hypothetical protein